MRVRLLGAITTAAVLLPLGVMAIGPASAGTGHARYVALAGDDDYLIYAKAVSSNPLDPASLTSTAGIYALGRNGEPIHLGKALTSPEVISLSQSNVVIVNKFRHHHRLRAWNLDTGRHTAIGTNEDVVGATPSGWIALDKGFIDGTHVVARSYSGDIVDYGTPITPGIDYGVSVGPNGFVAYSNNFQDSNGEVTYTRWAHPAVHRTLVEPGGKKVRCDSVSDSYAACIIGGGALRSLTLIALSGDERMIAGNRCAYQPAVWGARVAWGIGITAHDCETNHVGVTNLVGSTRVSDQKFNILGLVVAWGRVITSSRGERSLVKIASIRHAAKPLNRANVS